MKINKDFTSLSHRFFSQKTYMLPPYCYKLNLQTNITYYILDFNL